ncbi:FtsX-like permease family protein [Paraclostridium tenue]|uniref:FtsX-like permease family protein n=1 Tax=Paraclostridium tenue TaxID=1737 RepID=A0ABP3XG03_9FIRM
MKNPLLKDTFREIKKSKGRFISVFAIITLGVSFFTGIKVASPVMKLTADKYYDDNNLMDITVISNLGLTDEDVKAISKVDKVDNVYPTHSKEALTSIGTNQLVLKIHGLPDKENSKDYINKVNITKGRYPKNLGECVIEDSLNIPIGSTIKLYGDNNENLGDTLRNIEYKVVGKVETPYYISNAKGSSNIGNGQLDGFIMVPDREFKLDAYTEIYATAKDSKKFNSYDNKYEDHIKKTKNAIEDIGKLRANSRYKDIKNEANKKLDEGKNELKNQKKKVYKELSLANNNLKKSEKDLNNGINELSQKEKELNNTFSLSEEKIKEEENKLEDSEKRLNEKIEEFNKNKDSIQQQIDKSKEELKVKESEIITLKDYIVSIENLMSNEYVDDDKRKELEVILNQSKEKLKISKDLLNDANEKIKAKEQLFKETESKLLMSKDSIDKGKEEINLQKNNLKTKKKEALYEFEKAKSKLNKGKIDLEKGKKEYNKNKERAESELVKAEKKILTEEKKIKDIKSGKWYVLDRNTNYGFVDYKNSAESIESISKIFPVFFFSLSALICLTTMTRMVDEQRVNIGTMKALGYNSSSIMLKYILYSLMASVGGSILGNIIGFTVFPSIIYNAYNSTTYTLPNVSLSFDIKLLLLSTIIAVLTTTLASVYSCYKELKEVPSMLMRPKAPKEGKRILLERIPFIWNKLNFIQKVTCRNIFRYKKRFFMTIIGVAGCSALLVTGFGIKDSITSIVDNQYNNLMKYNLTLNYSKDVDKDIKTDEINSISKDSRINDYLNIKSKSFKAIKNSNKKDVTIIVPENKENINKFISLKNRANSKTYQLNDNGVLINEKLAKLLNVKIGDLITLENEENKTFKVKVDGIVENYVGHYIYMSPKFYKKVFKENVKFNQILINIKNKKISEAELGKDMMKLKNISSATFNTNSKESFSDMISNLNSVVILIIVSAGTLAFIVLYNLTNVNISERIREIATIKVLGFYDREVSSYVFRENVILAIIGTILGLFWGVFLHRFVMTTAELDFIMFGREIKVISFVLSALLTFVFATLVNLCIYYKLKKIKMVESLKSVD